VARNLLFGEVTNAAGRLGEEPVRSQGHIHARSPSCGRSTAELYEIWAGRAVILMQETADDDPGRCFAITAGPGEKVVVPPGWAHATISADPSMPLTFGAWCVRDFGFDYGGVRAHGGLAWFPRLLGDRLIWEPNPRYTHHPPLDQRGPNSQPGLGLRDGVPIWQHYLDDPEVLMWVPRPERADPIWADFTP
jgi:glucose-6-phosphate isomerase